MFKLAIVGSVLAYASAKHPVRQEVVDEIKKLTTKWTPLEVEANPLSKLSEKQIKGMCGTIITEPFGY